MSGTSGGAPRFPLPPPWADELLTIGVTGTNGKTSTVHWLGAALAQLDPRAVRISTLGHAIGGRPVEAEQSYGGFLQCMAEARQAGAQYAAIELTSLALGAGFLRGWPCSVGVLTSFSEDHLDVHGSPEHYLASKAQLFVQLPAGGHAILNGADAASALIQQVIGEDVSVWRYGDSATPRADLWATDVVLSWEGTSARLHTSARLQRHDFPDSIQLAAIGEVFVGNALAALLASCAAGVSPRAAAAAIEHTPLPSGRFELVSRAPYVVVDYAHTPHALGLTLRSARRLCRGELTVVLGAGGERQQSKRPRLGQQAAAADRVLVTSDNPRSENPAHIAEAICSGLAGHPQVITELDRRRAIELALQGAAEQDVIVIAGKGHEREQTGAEGGVPFSDAEVVAALTGQG